MLTDGSSALKSGPEDLLTEARGAVVDLAEARNTARQAAIEVEAEFGINDMLRTLLQMPQEIRRQKDAVLAAKHIVAEAKSELELQEAILVAQIAEQKDPKTGKAMFSNAEARKAELLKQMSISQSYKQAAQYLAEAETAYQAAQFDLDRLIDEFSALRAAVRMQTERLGLLRIA